MFSVPGTDSTLFRASTTSVCRPLTQIKTGDLERLAIFFSAFGNFAINDSIAGKQIVHYLDRFEVVTNTNLTRNTQQVIVSSVYPFFRVTDNIIQRLNSWLFTPVLLDRGNSKHIPANSYQLYVVAGHQFYSQGLYMDYSMEGAYKILTFVPIVTSFANALFTLLVVVLPTTISLFRAKDAPLTIDDVKALFGVDLACASYSSSILLPFNFLSGLIPVMEVLVSAQDPGTAVAQCFGSVVAVYLSSWRFAVGVLQLVVLMTLPSRFSWILAGFVTASFYISVEAGLAQQLEVYSRALVIVAVNYAVIAAVMYPAMRWYRCHYTTVIAHSSINTLVNIDVLFVTNSGMVFRDGADGQQSAEMEAFITNQQGRNVVVPKKRAEANGLRGETYTLITPSLGHALEAAARYKQPIWADFPTQTVKLLSSVWKTVEDAGVASPTVKPITDESSCQLGAFNPLTIL